jgi:hypothetical protein
MTYDFRVNATGPKLNFAATPGPGPDGNSLSVCTPPHAEQTVTCCCCPGHRAQRRTVR